MGGQEGRRRVVIGGVRPLIDGGRFPIKRVVGETVTVEADIFADGHDAVAAVVRYRQAGEDEWREAPMRPLGNDRWAGEFAVTALGRAAYTLRAWIDRFASWQRGLGRKVEAGQEVTSDLLEGALLVEAAAERAAGPDAELLRALVTAIRADVERSGRLVLGQVLSSELAALMARYPDRGQESAYDLELGVTVDRERARFSAWYELFPRSTSPEPGRHGAFADVERRLPEIAALGFDILYLPPIHPIGLTSRKGKNNAVAAGPGDPGSPWQIGNADGGHTAIHPELGTLADFDRLLAATRAHGMELALDIAFQCSPDHPYVAEHPDWFRHRPDGSIHYAENPPKKYQDIYPFDFESEDWRGLWGELCGVVRFWCERGVRAFRVDNPHTKPFAFWEWLIGEIKRDYPEVIFLSEAFTRPKVMYHLAKLGFTQSYTYFTWRTTKTELTDYLTELTRTEAREFFRPNFWPNTPDILTEQLQHGGRPAFIARLVLAATLGASYGIYGPAFEFGEHQPREPGSEEYLDSEKYEIRHWPSDRPDSLRGLIARLNQARRDNPALQSNAGLAFQPTDNDHLIAYSKRTPDGSNTILTLVNLDPSYRQSGWVDLDLEALAIPADRPFQVHDLLTDAAYQWHGPRNYVELDPRLLPAHVFRVRH